MATQTENIQKLITINEQRIIDIKTGKYPFPGALREQEITKRENRILELKKLIN